jgi:cyclic pyranopterin phosphate synthase
MDAEMARRQMAMGSAAAMAARIVEVGQKQVTDRQATAECVLTTTPEACARLIAGTRKGNAIEAARVAGVMGVKRTPDLLPFCHPIAVTGAEVVVEPDEGAGTIRVQVTVRAKDRTGAEMEALTAAAIAALSLYDTTKEFDRAARIDGLRLLAKSGGKSGDYRAE